MTTMKAMIRSIAALAMLAFSAPAFAGGVTVAQDGDSKLKIGAKFYINGTYSKQDTQAGTQKKDIGAALDRAYFSVNYTFNDVWSMGLTTDVAIAPANSNLKKRSTIYIKKAYLQGKFAPEFVLQAGVIGTPWIGHEEQLWAHRYVSKVFVDTYGLDSSADAGLGIKGKIADGMLDYHLTAINGAGYGNISKSNAIDFNGRIGLHPMAGLVLDGQLRSGYKGTKTWDAVNQVNTPGTKYTLYQGLISYGQDFWRVGGNFISNKATDNTTTIVTKTTGYDAFGWIKSDAGFGAFGRFESVKDKQDLQAVDQKTTRYVVGLEWFAAKHVTFSAAYDYKKVKNNGYTVGNFKKDTKAGLFAEVKF